TRVALKRPKGSLGLASEDAVLATRVEAEGIETPLKQCDIVAAEHWLAQIHESIAERESAFDQRRPGLGAADAVDAQPALLLKTLDGVSSRVRVVTVDANEQPGGGEALL